MKKRVLTLLASSFLSFKSFDAFARNSKEVKNVEMLNVDFKRQMAESAFLSLYNKLNYAGFEKPDYTTFRKGLIGFLNLRNAEQGNIKNILTIIDFNLPSTQKRMWVIDLEEKKVLFHELVAHGRNSGDNYATKFSNVNNSLSSSVGFYLTGEEYVGKYGRSLRLDGMEEGFNDRARERAVVFHGADYVSQAFIDAQGRLGRSYGCPAVPFENKDAIVDRIKDRSILFINGPEELYEQKSLILNSSEEAIDYFANNGFKLAPPV